MNASWKRFGPTLAELIVNSGYSRRNHNPDWVRFVAGVPGFSYETLRKAVADERAVSETLMRRVAAALNVEPSVFLEFRLLQARHELDPLEVGWRRAADGQDRSRLEA